MQITSQCGQSKFASNFSTIRTNGILDLPCIYPGLVNTVKVKKMVAPSNIVKINGNQVSEFISKKGERLYKLVPVLVDIENFITYRDKQRSFDKRMFRA